MHAIHLISCQPTRTCSCHLAAIYHTTTWKVRNLHGSADTAIELLALQQAAAACHCKETRLHSTWHMVCCNACSTQVCASPLLVLYKVASAGATVQRQCCSHAAVQLQCMHRASLCLTPDSVLLASRPTKPNPPAHRGRLRTRPWLRDTKS
jgi:hypothetical protein